MAQRAAIASSSVVLPDPFSPIRKRQRAAKLHLDRSVGQERQPLDPVAAARRIDPETAQQQTPLRGSHRRPDTAHLPVRWRIFA